MISGTNNPKIVHYVQNSSGAQVVHTAQKQPNENTAIIHIEAESRELVLIIAMLEKCKIYLHFQFKAVSSHHFKQTKASKLQDLCNTLDRLYIQLLCVHVATKV